VNVSHACRLWGVSRQAYYQHLRRTQRRQVEAEMALALLRQVRAQHPRMGLRKVYHLIRPQLRAWGFSMGRDRLFSLAQAHDLLVPRRRNPRRTTWRGHRRYPNRLANLTLTAPGQAWVADITYLFTEHGHRYLYLLMDAFSRYIVGWHLSASLAVEGALQALARAQTHTPGPQPGCVHHSDHGVQYTARAYQQALQQGQLQPSMGRIGNAYDNALAERVIGTLKTEYGIEGPFPSQEVAYRSVHEAITLYNHARPHWALALATPADVHFMPGSWT